MVAKLKDWFSNFLLTIDKSRIGRWVFQVLIFSLIIISPVVIITIFYLRDEIGRVPAILFGIALLVNIIVASVLVYLVHIFTEKHELQDIKVRDEALFQALTNGVIMFDAKKHVLLANPVATRLTGLPREGYYLPELYKLFPSLDLEKKIDEAIKVDKVIHIEEASVVNFFFEIFIVSVKYSQEEIIGGAIILHDITYRKELDLAKSEFVSLASHQLRTPLSTVSWYAEMLLAGDAGKVTDEQKKYLEEIYHSNKRMVELVNALLNVSRLELGTFVVEPQPTNVAKLARSVIDEQKPAIDEKKIHLQPNFTDSLPTIQADQKLLRMVFQNLLSNAVKYTGEDGTIEFVLSMVKKGQSVDTKKTNEDSIAIKVADTGYGIPKTQQDKIFTKLFRADNVREKITEGTGLGLYIVKSIIDHSGGKIWFESEENKGTTFYVTMPISGMKAKSGTKTLA